MLVYVHNSDNGLIDLVTDGAGRHAGNVALNVLAFGPFGLMSPKNLSYVCVECGKVFVRNVYAFKRDEKMEKAMRAGEVSLQEYVAPTYVPNK